MIHQAKNTGGFMVSLLVGVSGLALSGCATIVSGTSKNIDFQVQDAETQALVKRSRCDLRDAHGNVYVLRENPDQLTMSQGAGPLQWSCGAPGYRSQRGTVVDRFNPLTFVNVFFWPGFIVDALSGAYKQLPGNYTVMLNKQ